MVALKRTVDCISARKGAWMEGVMIYFFFGVAFLAAPATAFLAGAAFLGFGVFGLAAAVLVGLVGFLLGR